MKVCIIGNGLTALTLAKVLEKKDLLVDIFFTKKFKKSHNTRVLGISKSNTEYFNKEILNIENISWKINTIKVFSETVSNNELLKFSNPKKEIFSIIENQKLYNMIENNLKKKKKITFKQIHNHQDIFKDENKLVINCDLFHPITKKYFSNNIRKNYNSFAYTALIKHKKIKNDIAVQIFTNNGPIAFLPISNTKTSVVYSYKNINFKNEVDIKKLIKEFNPKYEILDIIESTKFELKSSHLRKYYDKNILAFGDLLHKIHPHAGQGFNMSLRDIKQLSELIDKKLDLGLDLNNSILDEFQKKTKSSNFVFSAGIDLIYEIFNFERQIKSKFIIKSIQNIGKNKIVNKIFKKFADDGLRI